MKLVTLQDLEEDALRAVAPGIEIVRADRNSVESAVPDADILIGDPGERWGAVLRAAPKLRWVHVGSAGVDGLVGPELRDSQVVLTCAKGDVAGPLLAEHAFALALGLSPECYTQVCGFGAIVRS